MSNIVRIGVIGCGSVSSKYLKLAEQLQFRGQAQVVAACDIVESRSQKYKTTMVSPASRPAPRILSKQMTWTWCWC